MQNQIHDKAIRTISLFCHKKYQGKIITEIIIWEENIYLHTQSILYNKIIFDK